MINVKPLKQLQFDHKFSNHIKGINDNRPRQKNSKLYHFYILSKSLSVDFIFFIKIKKAYKETPKDKIAKIIRQLLAFGNSLKIQAKIATQIVTKTPNQNLKYADFSFNSSIFAIRNYTQNTKGKTK